MYQKAHKWCPEGQDLEVWTPEQALLLLGDPHFLPQLIFQQVLWYDLLTDGSSEQLGSKLPVSVCF